MSQGLQVWDANGVTMLDLSTRTGLVIGTINASLSNGSFTDARLSAGTPFWIATAAEFAGLRTDIPIVTISGTSISWTFRYTDQDARVPVQIIYGVR